MEKVRVPPFIIQDLQKFEEKKQVYTIGTENENEGSEATYEEEKKGLKYIFQHPLLRVVTPCVTFALNIYLYSVDPISLSVTDCHITGVGHLYSLVLSNYPPDGLSALKLFLWVFGLLFGVLIGKMVIHYCLFCKILHLKLFSKEGQGSWIICFLFIIVVLLYQSSVYNAFLTLSGPEWNEYKCSSNLHVENRAFMRATAVIVWLGNIYVIWMVVDMILQERKYEEKLRYFKRMWRGSRVRIVLFWSIIFVSLVVIVIGVSTDFVNWNAMNFGFTETDELSRAFIASMVVALDFIIVMQDCDFPHFSGAIGIKLPGVHETTGLYLIKLPGCCSLVDREVHVDGKWFNYSVLFLLVIFNLNQWKNQLYYEPQDYGQYTDSQGYIYTITDRDYIFEALSTEGQNASFPLKDSARQDVSSSSKYLQYSVTTKGTSFIPVLLASFAFVYFAYKSTREEGEAEKMLKRWCEDKFFSQNRRKRKITPMLKDDDHVVTRTVECKQMPTIDKNNTTTFTYYFQHPTTRLLVAYTGVFLSWLVIAEAPIAHSHKQAEVKIIGNIYMLVFGSYPEKPEYKTVKCIFWVSGLISGLWVGKYFVHKLLLNKLIGLKLFHKGQGSWIVMFISTVFLLYLWSLAFNKLTQLDPNLANHTITNEMSLKYTTFMKGVGLVSFLSHLLFVLMVTDVILQDRHFPRWAPKFRKIWSKEFLRIPVLWSVTITMTTLGILAITDIWKHESISIYSMNELGRVCLASAVVAFDFIILCQDWEFPRFKLNQTSKLPGFTVSKFDFKLCCIKFTIEGKWFTYGLMGIILFIDCYNYNNELKYHPSLYNQFVNEKKYIVSVLDSKIKANRNFSKESTFYTNYTNGDGREYSHVNAIMNENKHNRNDDSEEQRNTTQHTSPKYEQLNAKFLGYDDDTKYSVSLLLIISVAVFTLWFGVKQSNHLGQAEWEERMLNVPRIEDIKITRHMIDLKPLGNAPI